MKKVAGLLAFSAIFGCSKTEKTPQNVKEKVINTVSKAEAVNKTAAVNKPDHIIFVWFENHAYSKIVGSSSAPYMNSLIQRGTLFTNAHAITHPSYPNYIAWFSGDTQGINSDACVSGAPKTAPTIYNALLSVGLNFTWYSEGLPATGSEICSTGEYREKHNPTTIFSQMNQSRNIPFSKLDVNLQDTAKLKTLVKIACVTPNMQNDMHDGSIQKGDAWLKSHFEKYVDWAMTHNSILVVYWDEDDRKEGNRIPVIMVGQHVKPNNQVAADYNHYSFTKLGCSLFGASTSWAANVDNAALPTGWEY